MVKFKLNGTKTQILRVLRKLQKATTNTNKNLADEILIKYITVNGRENNNYINLYGTNAFQLIDASLCLTDKLDKDFEFAISTELIKKLTGIISKNKLSSIEFKVTNKEITITVNNDITFSETRYAGKTFSEYETLLNNEDLKFYLTVNQKKLNTTFNELLKEINKTEVQPWDRDNIKECLILSSDSDKLNIKSRLTQTEYQVELLDSNFNLTDYGLNAKLISVATYNCTDKDITTLEFTSKNTGPVRVADKGITHLVLPIRL